MENKVIGLLVFSVLLLSIFSGVAAAAWEDIKDGISGTFNDWAEGSINNVFTKILILIIITLFVFSILDGVGLFGNQNKVALFVISLVVGILSTYYMTNLYAITQIYNAFGGAIITIVPFFIIGAFTTRAIIDGNVQLMVMQHVAWGIFAAFLLYGLFFNTLIEWTNPIYLGVTILALFLTFANGFALNLFNRAVLRARTIRATNSMEDMASGANILRSLGRQSRE